MLAWETWLSLRNNAPDKRLYTRVRNLEILSTVSFCLVSPNIWPLAPRSLLWPPKVFPFGDRPPRVTYLIIMFWIPMRCPLLWTRMHKYLQICWSYTSRIYRSLMGTNNLGRGDFKILENENVKNKVTSGGMIKTLLWAIWDFLIQVIACGGVRRCSWPLLIHTLAPVSPYIAFHPGSCFIHMYI